MSDVIEMCAARAIKAAFLFHLFVAPTFAINQQVALDIPARLMLRVSLHVCMYKY
jgi:hypothetical protein